MATTRNPNPKTIGLKPGRVSHNYRQLPRLGAPFYPTSDGKPMAETDKHVSLIVYSREGLRLRYAAKADSVYVGANNFLFYEEGNPKARVSPDTYVVFGVPQRERDSFKTWEEGGRTPAVVFEFTSKKTQAEDMAKKYHLYEQVLKVPEYVLFDPTGDYLTPRLKGFRLIDGKYVPIELFNDRLYSEQLGLKLVIDGVKLRFFDPATGQFLPSLGEADALRAKAEARQQEAERQRQEVEMRLREAELLRQEAETKATAESEARVDAEAKAETEAGVRVAAEAENERLRTELEALRRQLAAG